MIEDRSLFAEVLIICELSALSNYAESNAKPLREILVFVASSKILVLRIFLLDRPNAVRAAEVFNSRVQALPTGLPKFDACGL